MQVRPLYYRDFNLHPISTYFALLVRSEVRSMVLPSTVVAEIRRFSKSYVAEADGALGTTRPTSVLPLLS